MVPLSVRGRSIAKLALHQDMLLRRYNPWVARRFSDTFSDSFRTYRKGRGARRFDASRGFCRSG